MKNLFVIIGILILPFVVGCRSQANGIFTLANVTVFPKPESAQMQGGVEMASASTNGMQKTISATGIISYQGNMQKAEGDDTGNSPTAEIPISFTGK